MCSKTGGNVARTLSLLEMWPKTGRSVSKLAQKGSKGAKTVQKVSKRVKYGSTGVKMGQKVPIRANEGVRVGQNGGEEGQGREKSHEWSLSPSLSVRKWSLVRPFRGTKRPFSGGSSSQCEALGSF